ncbi:MAG: hypothetical protein IKN75_01295 [Prevotella sp.]|nr:hypothetical protein [Prevotella sp.]
MKRYLINILLVLTACVPAAVAQSNLQVSRTQDRTFVTMDFVLDTLNVPSNRYRAFTPVIKSKDGTQQQRLKTLIVSGRRQNIVFQRDGIDPLYAANCVNIRRMNGEPQRYAYSDAVQTEPWFRNADIYMESDLCGCGDQLKNEQKLLASLLPPDPYELIALTDVVPAVQKKERNLHGSAFVTFVVNKWEMKPDCMDNRRELRKITDTLSVMAKDPNVSVREIKIHGYASPESPYAHNKMLATNRAQSLTNWLKQQYNLPANVFAPAEATPENWEGLRKAVAEADGTVLPHKQEILSIIDDGSLAPDPKEQRIKTRYGEEYRYLLREVYPTLRRSDYDISFSFSDFTLEQAKEIYRKRPYQLSVRELWDVAQTMEKGSDEYNKVLQTAVNVYPDDPVANLNLANVAIRQKDLLKAETLLSKAGDSAEALQTRAVLAILQEKYDEAGRLLDQAAQKGLDVTKNREAIEKLTN